MIASRAIPSRRIASSQTAYTATLGASGMLMSWRRERPDDPTVSVMRR